MTRRANAPSPRELLERFDLIEEAALADLLGLTVKTLRNRPRQDLPSFVLVSRGRRLYRVDSVRRFLEARTVRGAV